MTFQVLPDYQPTAAAASDFFTRCARGEIDEVDPATGDSVRRPERVLATGRYVDFEGDVNIGESTVRHMAHLFGMVDGWRVQRLARVHEETLLELTALSEQNARLIGEVERLEGQRKVPVRVYVDEAGVEHSSPLAAEAGSRVAKGRPRKGAESLAPITAAEAPLPVAEVEAVSA